MEESSNVTESNDTGWREVGRSDCGDEGMGVVIEGSGGAEGSGMRGEEFGAEV